MPDTAQPMLNSPKPTEPAASSSAEASSQETAAPHDNDALSFEDSIESMDINELEAMLKSESDRNPEARSKRKLTDDQYRNATKIYNKKVTDFNKARKTNNGHRKSPFGRFKDKINVAHSEAVTGKNRRTILGAVIGAGAAYLAYKAGAFDQILGIGGETGMHTETARGQERFLLEGNSNGS